MNWHKIEFQEEFDRSSSPSRHIMRYEHGPHAPAEAVATLSRPVEHGKTVVEGPSLPEGYVDCGYGPGGFSLRPGLTGELGGANLSITRPSFGPLPSQRAIHIDVDNRRWSLISAGFNQVELRRGGTDGEAVFRLIAVSTAITPEEMAIVMLLEGLGSPFVKTKIFAQLTANI